MPFSARHAAIIRKDGMQLQPPPIFPPPPATTAVQQPDPPLQPLQPASLAPPASTGQKICQEPGQTLTLTTPSSGEEPSNESPLQLVDDQGQARASDEGSDTRGGAIESIVSEDFEAAVSEPELGVAQEEGGGGAGVSAPEVGPQSSQPGGGGRWSRLLRSLRAVGSVRLGGGVALAVVVAVVVVARRR